VKVLLKMMGDQTRNDKGHGGTLQRGTTCRSHKGTGYHVLQAAPKGAMVEETIRATEDPSADQQLIMGY
jgi:hypothetical protein